MAKVHVADVVADLRGVRLFARLIQRGRGSFSYDGLRRGAAYLARKYKERFIKNAGGGGNWAPLDPDYAKRKEANNDLILIEHAQLVNAFEFTPTGNREFVVHLSQESHSKFPGSIEQLAIIHQELGVKRKDGIIRRSIMLLPGEDIKRQIKTQVASGVAKDVQRANNATKGK